MNCPNIKCGIEVADGDSFCERCGTTLREDAVAALMPPSSPPPTIIQPTNTPARDPCLCGATADEITADGECGGCGRQRLVDGKLVHQEREPSLEALPDNPGNPTHSEQVLSDQVAVVSDIGARTRHSNQDFGLVEQFTVGAKTFKVAVVCDGLSTALNSAVAAKEGCIAFVAKVKQVITEGVKTTLEAVRLGIDAAQAAVLAVPFNQVAAFDDPETTIVAVLVENDRLATFGWVGDSRGYVLLKESGRLVGRPKTRDHSWVNQVVDAGRMTLLEALGRDESSTVLRSLGPLRAGETFQPSFNAISLDGAYAVFLCCDGIHKYVDPFAGNDKGWWHAVNLPPKWNALDLAKSFVDYANQSGGGDNNTAAILVCEPIRSASNPPTAAK
jgi:serine/threonine protein phosphatase PrpC